MNAGMAVAIFPDADAHVFEEFIGADERRKNLDGHGLLRARRSLLPHVGRGSRRGLMGDHRMARVGLVFDQHLPIAIMHVAQHAAGDFEPSGGRAIDHIVDAREAFAEKFFKTDAGRTQSREDEAAIIVDIGDDVEAMCGVTLFEPRVVIAFLLREREQAAVGPVSPGVIGAAEKICLYCRKAR